MTETSRRSIRILMDLQTCQTESSGPRGVGRLSHALFEHVAACCDGSEIHAAVSRQLPVGIDLSAIPRSRVHEIPALPAWGTRRNFRGGDQDSLDSIAYSALAARLNADVVHVSHAFEGYHERVGLPSPHQRPAGQVLSATLYDLIPLLFREHYFQDEAFRKWYLGRMTWLQQADLLLAISEATRQDAIDLLGIEPSRIVTIYGGVSGRFRPLADPGGARRDLAARYGLRERYVLYTGGDDHRKNLKGAIEGYAAVPAALRKSCQLVIVCAMADGRKQMHLDHARAAGLEAGDVLVTGFVPEDELVAFYGCCDLFVFPSLYEGLGLPVLEAMACGAPVVGADNSSIRELIVRPDALFDVASSRSTGDAIGRALTDKAFADDLRRHGLARSKDFSWTSTAGRAIDAFDGALRRARQSGIRAAVRDWMPRRRIAVFTPLPPSRSGIADYNARFLPYLSRHFEIDLYVDNYKVADEKLSATFRIFNASDFEAVAHAYDAILYEFGNSEFHAHMVPFLAKYPGVVGLHDAYLSGLFGYLDFNLRNPGSYMREMLAAHGPRARRFFAPTQRNADPIMASMIELPCTKRVLDQAIGVISHSPFNLEVARRQYPEGWGAPYRIIPQMAQVPRQWSAARRLAARSDLGFKPGDLVITTFGHITWNKCGDRLLDAFVESALGANPDVSLVFAGSLVAGAFGHRLSAAITRAGLDDRVRITGFLSDEDYEKYLRVSDVAVQLRSNSRGGTPKAVLDCLAYGLPVVVNNDASFTDYPDGVTVKVHADPPTAEIAAVLLDLCASPAKRAALAEAGVKHVRERHDPAQCAAEYAAAIHEFTERHNRTQPSHYVDGFAPYLSGCADPAAACDAAARWIESLPARDFRRRRLYIDVSHIAAHDHRSGIQRVVRQIVRSLYCLDRTGYEPVAFELAGGGARPAIGWLKSQDLLVAHETAGPAEPVEFRAGDVLLMLDSSWERYREFFPVFDKARRAGVPVYTAIYDLLPMRLPPGNFVEGGREWFEKWFRDAVEASDGLVCISNAVADEVLAYLDDRPGSPRRPKVGYWHLGSGFTLGPATGSAGTVADALPGRPYLLMVGTVEPRKCHALALAAMERLWERGHELCLCIAGKEGWLVGELMERLRGHPLRGSKLFLYESASDADIDALYANAAGLLFLSMGEGFGLPLVEAAARGIPILCSDIPVFHEVAGSFATYIGGHDAERTASDLEAWHARKRSNLLPDTGKMPSLTWEQSAGALLDVIFNGRWKQ